MHLRSICTLVAAVLGGAAFAVSAATPAAAEKGLKQPVFVLCPHAEHYSAWSLYLMVDPDDPKKVVSLGLEKLKSKNSKDSSYEDVIAAQSDPKAEREFIAAIEAKDFGSGELTVAKDNALHVSLAPAKDGYSLMVSLRISADDRFVIGGKDARKRDLALTYDAASKRWVAQVKQLRDDKGAPVNGATGQTMTGIAFKVIDTGIYTIMGVLDSGESVMLLDRGGMKE